MFYMNISINFKKRQNKSLCASWGMFPYTCFTTLIAPIGIWVWEPELYLFILEGANDNLTVVELWYEYDVLWSMSSLPSCYADSMWI